MSPPLHPDLLMTHAGALRSMARALLGDEHAAEDVVQETWVRALSARPSTDRGLGGWLRGVAEGFALQRRRSEGRRVERERAYASERREALDSEQRGAVLRTVMEAVLALDEPYRETVLLRWFEGLPPCAIAERLGVRVATVDSRLQRAHARLRAKLERELGDGDEGWRAIVAVALGAPPRNAPLLATSAIPLIGVAVSLKLVGAVLAAVVGACLWLGWDRTRPPVVEPVELAAGGANAKADAALAATEKGGEREAVASPTSTPADAPAATPVAAEPSGVLERGPYGFALRVEVVDADERPVHGAAVFLGPLSCSPVSFGETGWDGVLAREWRGFDPRFEGVLYVRWGGTQTSLRRVSLAAGTPWEARFQLEQQPQMLTLSFGVFTAVEGSPEIVAHDEFALDEAGNGYFVDSMVAHLVARATPKPAEGSTLRTSVVRTGRVLTATSVDVLANEGDQAREPAAPARATVRGIVRDEHGNPLSDLVVAGRTPERWNTGVVCDADGAFVFADVPPGPMEVCVGGGERVLVREVFELAPGETRYLELRPVPRPTLRVRLLDGEARPLAQWVVEARRAGSPSWTMGVAATDDVGAALVGLDTDGPVLLYARPQSAKSTAAVPVGECSSSAREEIQLRARGRMVNGSLAFTIEGPELVETAEARAWRVDSGEGVALKCEPLPDAPDSGVAVTSRGLLPGAWRVEWRTNGRVWTELGRFEVAAGEELQLGSIVVPDGARVVVTAEGAQTARVRLALRFQADGATVVWPERTVELPATIETLSMLPMEILRRAVDVPTAPVTVPLHDPLRLRAGIEQPVVLPDSRQGAGAPHQESTPPG